MSDRDLDEWRAFEARRPPAELLTLYNDWRERHGFGREDLYAPITRFCRAWCWGFEENARLVKFERDLEKRGA